MASEMIEYWSNVCLLQGAADVVANVVVPFVSFGNVQISSELQFPSAKGK
jgi:hypothetical protein